MRLTKLEDGGVLFERINDWEKHALTLLPKLADFSGKGEAEKRLLPAPAVETDLTPEMAMDWVEFVTPQLRSAFQESLDVVVADLRGLEPESPPVDPNPWPKPGTGTEKASKVTWRMSIPLGHADHWFRAMNQARLVMSAQHGIDSENAPDFSALLASGQLEMWFYYEFFVSLQVWLVEYVMDSP